MITLRGRKKLRSLKFESVKENFLAGWNDHYFTIHWNEKLLKGGKAYTHKQHLAVLASSTNGKLVKLSGITDLDSGTGLNQAKAVKNILEEWSIEHRCVATCFDTTASNTGKFVVACILVEALIGHPLLWTSCRRHILEVILGDVFKVIFGPFCSPKVKFFEILKSKRPTLNLSSIDQSDLTNLGPLDSFKLKAQKSLQHLCSDESTYLPRDDFDELLKLSLFYLEQQSVTNFAFRRLGTQHCARWMSTPIYGFKMYLLRSQLDVDAALVNGLRRFCNLVSIFYAPYWLQCPLASEVAVNDVEFHRAMMNYSSVDKEVAEAARHVFLRRRWYSI